MQNLVAHYFVAGFLILGLFILFLVISKTLNGIVNYLIRIEFLINTEYEFRREEMDVRRVLFESFMAEEGEELEGLEDDDDEDFTL